MLSNIKARVRAIDADVLMQIGVTVSDPERQTPTLEPGFVSSSVGR